MFMSSKLLISNAVEAHILDINSSQTLICVSEGTELEDPLQLCLQIKNSLEGLRQANTRLLIRVQDSVCNFHFHTSGIIV
jgi:hypothetical protein